MKDYQELKPSDYLNPPDKQESLDTPVGSCCGKDGQIIYPSGSACETGSYLSEDCESEGKK